MIVRILKDGFNTIYVPMEPGQNINAPHIRDVPAEVVEHWHTALEAFFKVNTEMRRYYEMAEVNE